LPLQLLTTFDCHPWCLVSKPVNLLLNAISAITQLSQHYGDWATFPVR
jgi:hypothetical protein